MRAPWTPHRPGRGASRALGVHRAALGRTKVDGSTNLQLRENPWERAPQAAQACFPPWPGALPAGLPASPRSEQPGPCPPTTLSVELSPRLMPPASGTLLSPARHHVMVTKPQPAKARVIFIMRCVFRGQLFDNEQDWGWEDGGFPCCL